MQIFKKYFNDKLKDPSFKELFEQECHVCRDTLQIFHKMSYENHSIEEMAALLHIDPQDLRQLQDADCCDPYLVVRLCHELDLPHPGPCPRRND